MFRLQRLKLMYALAGSLWTGYYSVGLLRYHITNHVPFSSGFFFCLLLFVSVPAFGYFLLFMLFPLAGRLLRR